MSISEQKRLLRKEMNAQRLMMSIDEWSEKSSSIRDHFLSSKEFADSKIIHCFISMNQRFEVNTHSLIKMMLEQKKRVIVPVTNFTDSTLSHCEIKSLDELEMNKWGVLEPKVHNQIDIPSLDLVLVPILAADIEGNRLGYGKGFYDRFLGLAKALKFGLIFDEFILSKIPTEPFDEKMNGLISESGIKYT